MLSNIAESPEPLLHSRYALLKLLASHAEYDDFLAEDRNFPNRKVVLRVLGLEAESDQTQRGNFKQHAALSLELTSPRVLRSYDYFSDSEISALVLEYFPGVALSEQLARTHWYEPEEVLSLADQLDDLLKVFHSAGQSLGGLRPEDLLISSSNKVKLYRWDHAQQSSSSSIDADYRTLAEIINQLVPRSSSFREPAALEKISTYAAWREWRELQDRKPLPSASPEPAPSLISLPTLIAALGVISIIALVNYSTPLSPQFTERPRVTDTERAAEIEVNRATDQSNAAGLLPSHTAGTAEEPVASQLDPDFAPPTTDVATGGMGTVQADSIAKASDKIDFIHTVSQPGETISLLAEWYLGDLKAWPTLVKTNPKLNPNIITMGQQITIPGALAIRRNAPRAEDLSAGSTTRKNLGSSSR
jgi:serine/threonine protein kinase